jgi:hypothetical protein
MKMPVFKTTRCIILQLHINLLLLYSILLAGLSSCSSKIKIIESFYGRELLTPRSHLFSSSKLVIRSDSTFEYSEGGPAIRYSAGSWSIYKNEIILATNMKRGLVIDKVRPDSVFFYFDNEKVRVRNRNSVILNGKIFTAIKD